MLFCYFWWLNISHHEHCSFVVEYRRFTEEHCYIAKIQVKIIQQQNKQESIKLLSVKIKATKQVKTFQIVVRKKIYDNKTGKNIPNYCTWENNKQQNKKKPSKLLSEKVFSTTKQTKTSKIIVLRKNLTQPTPPGFFSVGKQAILKESVLDVSVWFISEKILPTRSR